MTVPSSSSAARDRVNRYTSHTAHYRCAQPVRTSHMMLHAHAWLKFKFCLPQNSHSISCAMSHAMHSTRSTSSSSFSSVPGLQRLLTSRIPALIHENTGVTDTLIQNLSQIVESEKMLREESGPVRRDGALWVAPGCTRLKSMPVREPEDHKLRKLRMKDCLENHSKGL